MRNNNIREKRKVNFNGRVITNNVIRAIAEVIEKEVAILNMDELHNSIIVYSVDANDDSSYESQSSGIFGSMLDQKVVQKVTMRFSTLGLTKSIEVMFTHTNDEKSASNYILISGDDNNWVNGVLQKFNDCMNLSKKQKLPSQTISFGFAILFWTLVYLAYQRIAIKYLANIDRETLESIDAVVALVAMVLGFVIMSLLSDLWPNVELQTGPSHLQYHANRRKKLIGFFTLVVLPLVLTYAYTLIGDILN